MRSGLGRKLALLLSHRYLLIAPVMGTSSLRTSRPGQVDRRCLKIPIISDGEQDSECWRGTETRLGKPWKT